MTKKATSGNISARVPVAFAAEITARAKAAGLTKSEYIYRSLRGRKSDYYPALAALAGVLQIAAIVQQRGACSPALSDALNRHVSTLARAAQSEMP